MRGRRRRVQRERHADRLQRPLADATETDPYAATERGAEGAQVRAALLRLHFKDAEILALRYGGLTYREIAQTTGIDAAQIGTRLSRAERALKREIEREAFE